MRLHHHQLLFLAAVLLGSGAAAAQELDPRTFSPAPVGTTILVSGIGRSRGGFVLDPSLGIEDVQADLSFTTTGVGYVFDLAGRQARLLAVLPVARGDVRGDVGGIGERQELSGPVDPRFKLTVGFHGAPALSLEEIRNAPRRTAITGSLTVVAPWGDYDSQQLVNLGNHRWAVKPEVGVYQPLGKFTVEGYAGAWFFGSNDAYYPGRATKRQQELLSLHGHVGYALGRRAWISFDGTWFSGGRTSVDHVANPDRQDNLRLGGTLSVPITARQSLKLAYGAGTSTRRGSDYDTVTLTWQAVRLPRSAR